MIFILKCCKIYYSSRLILRLCCFVILIFVIAAPSSACRHSSIKETVSLPILMYHHLSDTGDGSVTVTPETFETQLMQLIEKGYTAVSFDEIIAYADGRGSLPEKPVCIVFDDGYESNLTLALPILEKYNIPATICIIGSLVGCDTYKDTGNSIVPHFSWMQAQIAAAGGLITFGSHSYDMHMYAPYESGIIREYAARLASESEAVFGSVFAADHAAMCALMEMHLGYTPTVFAYPHGKWDTTAEAVLRSSGVRVTLTTDAHINTVRYGDQESLYLLGRFSINEFTHLSEMIDTTSHKPKEKKE